MALAGGGAALRLGGGGGETRGACVDLHLVVRHVGHGVNRQLPEGPQPARHEQERPSHDQEALTQAEADNAFDHVSPVFLIGGSLIRVLQVALARLGLQDERPACDDPLPSA